MIKLEINLKRVQTFIFEVPRLKAMLGANALIGQTMRHELPQLLGKRGAQLNWAEAQHLTHADDPLDDCCEGDDADDPRALYRRGILARDGGHFIVVFDDESRAQEFLREAEAKLAESLPGVQFEADIGPFPAPETRGPRAPECQEEHVLDLPILQVCEETGREPASERETFDGETVWQSASVGKRKAAGDRFYRGETHDIIGLMRGALYPDEERGWTPPQDLGDLASGDYLALIHADGNGIGKRFKDLRNRDKTDDPEQREARGEAFFHGMRVVVRRALVDALKQTYKADSYSGGTRPYELLMLGGDDLLMLCRANDALRFAHIYVSELARYRLQDGHPLHVAIGVAIAKKSYPLHRLNVLAEALAGSAKRLYRSLDKEDQDSVIDWQVVTQSWFNDLQAARRASDLVRYRVGETTETLLLTGRPYRVDGEAGLAGLLEAADALDGAGEATGPAEAHEAFAPRSPLRALRGACEHGRLAGEMAFARLPERARTLLAWPDVHAPTLWQDLGDGRYLTRALDLVGIREIARLGKQQND